MDVAHIRLHVLRESVGSPAVPGRYATVEIDAGPEDALDQHHFVSRARDSVKTAFAALWGAEVRVLTDAEFEATPEHQRSVDLRAHFGGPAAPFAAEVARARLAAIGRMDPAQIGRGSVSELLAAADATRQVQLRQQQANLASGLLFSPAVGDGWGCYASDGAGIRLEPVRGGLAWDWTASRAWFNEVQAGQTERRDEAIQKAAFALADAGIDLGRLPSSRTLAARAVTGSVFALVGASEAETDELVDTLRRGGNEVYRAQGEGAQIVLREVARVAGMSAEAAPGPR